jgi:peptide/nickel transport system ATP-binding protein
VTEQAVQVVEVRELRVHFGGTTVVDGVSFSLNEGECVGLVGASGSGKSVTSLALMRLLDPRHARIEGQVLHKNIDLLALDEDEFRSHRGRTLAMVFQEPMTALDPVYTVGEQVAEAVRLHTGLDHTAARARVVELFAEVLLPEPAAIYDRYPHQLSGGQKQRVVIAMALSCSPAVLICDEPTTALDVLVQREILDLLKRVQRERRMGMVFISHDLGVVREIADRALVMHAGRVVEDAPVERLFSAPRHPYTKGLIACRPDPSRHPVRLSTIDEVMRGETGNAAVRQLSPAERAAHVERLMAQDPILRVSGLSKEFRRTSGLFGGSAAPTTILHDIAFDLYPGESLGIVGGSGSGKTTLGRSILRLIEPTTGQVAYAPRGSGPAKELTALAPAEMRALRRELQIIFQDPYSALDPRLTIGAAILEAMQVHGIAGNDTERRSRIHALLERVGLEAAHYGRYPHQFSGGQRQRVVIARAIALEPRIVVCDESVAALDVSVQAQVLNLLNELKEENGLTYLFISHDLAVVKYFCDRILVLEQGRNVELRPSEDLYRDPQAAYTRRLLEAIPSLHHGAAGPE